MINQLLRVLGFTTIPVLATLLGGGLGLFWTPGPRIKSTILNFAAGVVLVTVTVEFLPTITKQHAPLPVIIGFALGSALMLGVRQVTQAVARPSGGLPIGFLVAIAIDLLLDGLLVGIGFAAGSEEGILLALAIALENFFVGLTTSTALRESGMPRRSLVITTVLLALTVAVGAILGVTVLAGLSGAGLAVVLSFGAAALLYLVVEELIEESDEGVEPWFATAMFFVGFLLFLIISMISPG